MKKKPDLNLHHLFSGDTDPVNCKPLVERENVHQRESQDVYEHACTITAWQQLYDQLRPGKFKGELTEILFDGVQIFREYTNLTLRQSCMVWPNAFWFGIPDVRGEHGFIGSQPLDSQEIAVRPGGREFELSTPDDYTILGVVVSYDVLFSHASSLIDPDRLLQLLNNNPALEVNAYQKEALWYFIHQALSHGSVDPQSMQRANVRKVLCHNLLTAMTHLLEGAQPVSTRQVYSRINYQHLVSQAREYLLSQTSEPVTVLDLCRELHVSRRTLQNAFHLVLGIGPNAWLKALRLNAVRRELVSPYSECHTVKDAAMQWGFWHLSQFATDYQRLFNEKPLASLAARGARFI